MKKLIPALCMLLVAAALMGTSTFAWFSINSQVTASSMQIKATTDANLYIAKGASNSLDSITGTAVTDLEVNSPAVKPAEMTADAGTVTVKYATGYSVEPTVSSAGTANAFATIGTITETTPADAASYKLSDYCAYAYVTIARKQTTAGQFKLTPSCTVTFANASNLNKALRVGLIINGTFYEAADANKGDTAENLTATFTFSDITGLDDNTAYSAALLMWFEGEDSDCTVNNAITLSNCTAAWTFNSATVVGG